MTCNLSQRSNLKLTATITNNPDDFSTNELIQSLKNHSLNNFSFLENHLGKMENEVMKYIKVPFWDRLYNFWKDTLHFCYNWVFWFVVCIVLVLLSWAGKKVLPAFEITEFVTKLLGKPIVIIIKKIWKVIATCSKSMCLKVYSSPLYKFTAPHTHKINDVSESLNSEISMNRNRNAANDEKFSSIYFKFQRMDDAIHNITEEYKKQKNQTDSLYRMFSKSNKKKPVK